MEISDADLIARVLLNDDRHAFATLVRRYQSMVRHMLRKLTKEDHSLADDLAQETFIKVYKNINKFRGEAKFSTWLFRIAYNIFISDSRTKKICVSLSESKDSSVDNFIQREDESVEQTNRLQENNRIDLKEDLNTAMNYLSKNERIAIQLCYQTGFSHSEAAQILNQPIGTIKTNIARGKEKLRDYLIDWKESVCYE